MKKQLILQFLFLFLLFIISVAPVFSQNSGGESGENSKNNTETMTENDRLPFMQNQQAAQVEEPSSGGLLFKTLGAMMLIVGLLFFGAWGLKKAGFGALKAKDSIDAPDLAVVSSISVGGGRTISAVRFGERVLLVGSTAQSFTLLAEEDKKNISAVNSAAKSRSVADLLAEEEKSFGFEMENALNRLETRENKGDLL